LPVLKTRRGDDEAVCKVVVSEAPEWIVERVSSWGTSLASLDVSARSALIAVGTFDMLELRGGRSCFRDEIIEALGAVDTLLGPLECS
jgi:hypothetical protein